MSGTAAVAEDSGELQSLLSFMMDMHVTSEHACMRDICICSSGGRADLICFLCSCDRFLLRTVLPSVIREDGN